MDGKDLESELAEWHKAVRSKMLPMMKESSIYVGLTPDGEPDPKFCVELGAAIMYDKPIVVISLRGRQVPAGLRRIAHMVLDDVDLENPASRDQVAAALRTLTESLDTQEGTA